MPNAEMYKPRCTILAMINCSNGNGGLYGGLILKSLAITKRGITKKITKPKDLCKVIIHLESKKS
ncbi:hypothetical protein FN3523_1825 [Francisella hispaniensis]|uniref:Uncharacterized protein n=1 Tax=Francisella hispaniensis TaxID=622488 RepID=F4BI34_9GAMM|nr:hypothetical protein FN3523_1825 [Francisella hispaniensis]